MRAHSMRSADAAPPTEARRPAERSSALQDDQLDPAILGPANLGIIRGDGSLRAESLIGHSSLGHALADEGVLHRGCALRGQSEVRGGITLVVGMTGHADQYRPVGLEHG